MSETIHVAYCLDDGYAEPTCVSMASMLANTKSNIHFHVISNRLSDENKNKLSSLSKHFSQGIWSFYSINFDTSRFVLEPKIHLTVEAYYRFFLPSILPELEKIIYVDGDTVIVGDILELWNENLDGKIAGVVSDFIDTQDRSKILELEYDWHYFNSGVLLLNLKEFSKLYTFDKLFEIINAIFNKFVENNVAWLADQEVLNYLIKGEKYAKFLTAKFNLEDIGVENSINLQPKNSHSSRLKEWIDCYKSPIIIHFVGIKKPWHLNSIFIASKYWRLYYKYKTLTPFYDPFDEKRILEYERREKITKTEAVLLTDTYIQFFWRDIFADAAEIVKRVIGNRKLVFWGVGQHFNNIMTIFALCGLYPDAIVDGLATNHNKAIFEYTVQSADILKGKSGEYFVVLTMQTKRIYGVVSNLLKEYGYNENGFVHAYVKAYERENKLLL